jgi:hypothetical protein
MSTPADTASSLLPSTVVGGSSGWTLFIGSLFADPDRQVAFTDTSGQSPNPAWSLDYPTFQVLVRGASREYLEAWTKAKEVKDVLLGIFSLTISGDRWDSVIMLGDIGFVHYDDNERPVFSMNFRCIIEPAVGSLSNRQALPA